MDENAIIHLQLKTELLLKHVESLVKVYRNQNKRNKLAAKSTKKKLKKSKIILQSLKLDFKHIFGNSSIDSRKADIMLQALWKKYTEEHDILEGIKEHLIHKLAILNERKQTEVLVLGVNINVRERSKTISTEDLHPSNLNNAGSRSRRGSNSSRSRTSTVSTDRGRSRSSSRSSASGVSKDKSRSRSTSRSRA
eukprot:Pgem_evm1s6197